MQGTQWKRPHLLASMAILLSGLTTMGCATFAKLSPRDPIAASALVSKSHGYIYGTFKLDRGFLNLTRLWLRIEDQSGKTFEVLFRTGEASEQALEVSPGTYRVKEFLFTPGGPASMLTEREITIIPVPSEAVSLAQPVRVEAGKGYYIGDFLGITRRDLTAAPLLFVSAEFQGSVVGISENFASASANVKKMYPGLVSVELTSAYHP